MGQWAALIAGAIIAGMIHTITGFGAGVLLIVILSNFYTMLAAPAINTSICLGLTVALTWKYRKLIRPRLIILPAIFYTAVSVSIIRFIHLFDLRLLALSFGVFLMVLSVFLLFVQKKVHLKGNTPTAIGAAMVSGLFSGLFGVGGPIMGLYLINVTDDHESYLANLEFLFTITNIINLTARAVRGIYTVDLIPVSLIGIGAVFLGIYMGTWIYRKINASLLKTIVYIFVGISGIVTLIQHL